MDRFTFSSNHDNMDADDNLKAQRKIQKAYAFASVCAVIILLYIVYYFSGFDFKYFKEKFIDSVFSSLLTIVIFNSVYEYLARDRTLKELQIAFVSTFADRIDIIRRLSTNEIKKIIFNCICSIMKEEKGSLIFANFVHPYLDGQYDFRKDYKYIISFEEVTKATPFIAGSKDIEPGIYLNIHQSISYKKTYNRDILEQLCIGFAYDEQTLDSWFLQDIFYFREVLHLSKEHIESMKKLNEGDLLDLMDNFFKFSVYYFNNLKDIKIEKTLLTIIKESNGFKICINLNDLDTPLLTPKNQKFKVEFTMPQLKSCRHFLAVIPEPTENPVIQFIYNNGMRNITPYTFFTTSINDDFKETTFNSIIFDIKTWVFPKSGVLLTWEEE